MLVVGRPIPTNLPPGDRLSHTTVVIDSAILVLRERLETILVLAAVMASFLGAPGWIRTSGFPLRRRSAEEAEEAQETALALASHAQDTL
jgi:hypothetical protein